MSTKSSSGLSQNPFSASSDEERATQCTPDNPFGTQSRPVPQLRSSEGIHYTSDPIAQQIKVLRAIQNTPQAAIGVAVGGNLLAALKAIQLIGTLNFAAEFIAKVLGYVEKALDEMPDKNIDSGKSANSKDSKAISVENGDRAVRYKDRQDGKANENGDTPNENDDGKKEATDED
jgi:hypothetical protein